MMSEMTSEIHSTMNTIVRENNKPRTELEQFDGLWFWQLLPYSYHTVSLHVGKLIFF